MEQHDIPTCLYDIRTSIDSIEEYLARFMGKCRDFSIYSQEKFLRRCVERELEIIGEATKRILQTNPEFKLTNARKIIDLRNTATTSLIMTRFGSSSPNICPCSKPKWKNCWGSNHHLTELQGRICPN